MTDNQDNPIPSADEIRSRSTEKPEDVSGWLRDTVAMVAKRIEEGEKELNAGRVINFRYPAIMGQEAEMQRWEKHHPSIVRQLRGKGYTVSTDRPDAVSTVLWISLPDDREQETVIAE